MKILLNTMLVRMISLRKIHFMKNLIVFLTLFISVSVSADFTSQPAPKLIFGHGEIRFGVSNPPSNVCNYYGRHFKFDATTESGKNMFSILLAAYMAGKNIAIWYSPSQAAGTDHNSGCNTGNLAVVTALGFGS